MSIHVCKCLYNGHLECHLRYPGMDEESAQRIADSINAGVDCRTEIVRLRAENERLADKALRFDLDRAGIEQREREAVELVELRAKNERLRLAAQAVVDRWHTPLWKDAEPTAAVFQRLKAALRGEGDQCNPD